MQNLKGKKLLILAGAGVHSKVVRMARELGIYTIVTDYLEDSPAKLLANESWMYSVTDVDGIVEQCKRAKIDGVLNFCIDPAQIPCQRICERLGLPCNATSQQFETFTDKRRFKRFCIDNDVDVIQEYTEADIIEGKVKYPIFIKPTNSRGSRGQATCYSKEEAVVALANARKESSDGGVICERYMAGHQDIASAFFVVNGEPHLVKFGDRYLGRKEDNLNKQVMCTCLPSSFSDMFATKVESRVKKMIKTLGIKYGPVFLQGFVDGDTIRYYDPGLRMPGGDYDLILEKATGFSTVKNMIHYALTGDMSFTYGDPKNAYLLGGGAAVLLTLSAKPGKMVHVFGMDTILNHPNVVYGRQIISEGSIIPASGDIAQRVAAIGAYLPNKEEIHNFLNYVYSTYQALDENGTNMIVSKIIYDK